MIFLVNSENRRQFAPDLSDMYRQRRIGLVDCEADGYDCEEAMYLLAKAQPEGQLLASARLLPTMGPHLMSDLLAEACRDTPPRGPTVWELSQFCTTADVDGRGPLLGLLWEILCGVMEAALLYGMDQIIFATNRVLLPLTLNCGWDARTLGPSSHAGEDGVTAVAARITPAGLGTVRRHHGVPAQVMRLLANAPPSAPGAFTCRSPLEAPQGMPYPGGWIGHFCYDWPSPKGGAP